MHPGREGILKDRVHSKRDHQQAVIHTPVIEDFMWIVG